METGGSSKRAAERAIPRLPALPPQFSVAGAQPSASGEDSCSAGNPGSRSVRVMHSGSTFDDLFAPLVANTVRRRRQLQATRRRRRAVVAATGPLVVVGLAAAGVALVVERDAPAPSPILASAQTAPWCASEVSANRVVGSGTGRSVVTGSDILPGAAEVLDLEHQMYVARSAEGTRSVMAPDAKVAPLQATRDAIAALPANTEHCVYVVGLGPGRLGVTVEEKRPDHSVATHDLVVATAQQPDGRTLITSISAGVGVR